MGQLSGEVALVTGGGSGLGRAVVERFIEEGARVGVLEKSKDKASDLESALGDNVHVSVGDVTVAADNQRAVDDTVAAFSKTRLPRRQRGHLGLQRQHRRRPPQTRSRRPLTSCWA